MLLLDGSETQTCSLHAAIAWREGKRWGCVLCWILGKLVETDHCAKQLEPYTEQQPAMLRAGALILMVCGLLYAAVYLLVVAVF